MKVMGTTPWTGKKGSEQAKDGDNYPATFLSWEDAQAFWKRANRRNRYTPADGWRSGSMPAVERRHGSHLATTMQSSEDLRGTSRMRKAGEQYAQ